jgi:lipoyl(octanoyl) transferase
MLNSDVKTAPAEGDSRTVEWLTSSTPVPYPGALAFMESRVAAIAAGEAGETVWLLEHPPLYTAGTSAKREDLLNPDILPVFETGRGGQYTYHGPGQRIAYVMLDLKARKPDVRAFVRSLEDWLIATLDEFGVRGERRCGRVGIWVRDDGRSPANCSNGAIRDSNAASLSERPDVGEKKIAAIGIRLRKWVSFHGIALNVNPDLSHYNAIVPCGLREHGVTSLADLGVKASVADVDAALRRNFQKVFES